MTLAFRYVCLDNRSLNAVYNANGVNTDFAIIEAIIHLLDGESVEDLDRVLERNAVTRNVPPILLGIPEAVHAIFTAGSPEVRLPSYLKLLSQEAFLPAI